MITFLADRPHIELFISVPTNKMYGCSACLDFNHMAITCIMNDKKLPIESEFQNVFSRRKSGSSLSLVKWK